LVWQLKASLPVLLAAVLLAGCASPQPAPRPPGASPLPPQSGTESPPSDALPAPSVTLALRRDSARAAAVGDTHRAIELLERAIRIEPAEPQLWLDLAHLHLEQGSFDEAEQFARKALSLAGDRYQLEQDAWLLIDHAQARTSDIRTH
jgi:Tfp pilus assembly protein PilF